MPNICPMCNTTLEMSPLFGFYDFDPLYRELKIPYVILKCPKCDRISFAAYEETTFEENSGRTADLIAYQLYPKRNTLDFAAYTMRHFLQSITD